MSRGPVPALIHKDEIIERVRRGERLIDIGKDYGYTTHAAISKYLASDPEYQAAREDGLAAKMDIREDALSQAQDMVTVAREKELLSHARWRAERECPRRWGSKQEINVNNTTVDINELLEQRRARIERQITGEVLDAALDNGSLSVDDGYMDDDGV